MGLRLVLSGFQYLNQWTRLLTMLKKTPAYNYKLRALELELNGGMTNKKKSHKQANKKVEEDEDLGKELDLQIKGAEKPSIWEFLGFRFILLPYTIVKLLLWNGFWYWRYLVKQAPYSCEDASYLTQRALGVPNEAWRCLGK